MALDVLVNMSTVTLASSVGFGVPLVLETKASSDIAFTKCSSLAEVVKAGFADNTEVYKACALIWSQNNAPKTIAVCQNQKKAVETLTELVALGKDFRHVLVTSLATSEESTIAEIATFIEATKDKLFFVNVTSSGAASTILSKERTVCMMLNDTSSGAAKNPVAALIGATAGLTPGSFTYKNIVLKGVNPNTTITDSELDALHAGGLFTVLQKCGDIVTSEGINTNKGYIDIVDSKDWIVSNIVYQTQKLLNNELKVPYTNVGIGMLEAVTIGVLKEAFEMGIIATNDENLPDFSTKFAARQDVPAGERAERKYVRGQFSCGLAGGIHSVNIAGTLII